MCAFLTVRWINSHYLYSVSANFVINKASYEHMRLYFLHCFYEALSIHAAVDIVIQLPM